MTDTATTSSETGSPPPSSRPAEYVADISFDDMNLSEPVRRAVRERGYEHPTPVQAKAYGPILEGKDLIVRSKTGTGKTAAFALPLLEKLPAGERQVKVLVMCPTRELALQVAAEMSDLAKHKDLRVSAIYGGSSMRAQEEALEAGSAVVVGTPGRVFDHIGRGNLVLSACSHVVLDEADEMLNQGFYEEVTRILDRLPKDRQVLLFSATVPPDIERLIAQYTRSAETLLLSGDVFTVEHIHHILYEVSEAYPKPRNLIYVIENEAPDNAIIFCNTKDDTALVTAVLNRNGFDAELLNGDLPQSERERVMGKVKRGEVAFMVATDIAARGIDISDLSHVINYSLPEDAAVYLHRVGRTGRIGNKGVAINLNTGRELGTLTTLEKKYGIKFEKRKMPLPEEAARLWTERHLREIREAAGSAVFEGYLPLAAQLRQRPDGEDLVAYLLKYFFGHQRVEKVQALKHAPPREERGRRREAREGDGGPRERRERTGERERPERKRSERPERAERSDRPERGERPERRAAAEPARAEQAPEPGKARLWVSLGKSDGLDEAQVTAALEGAGAPPGKVERIELKGTYSYAIVADADVPAFEALTGKPHGEKTLKVERSRPPRERARSPRAAPSSIDPTQVEGKVKLWVNLGQVDQLDDAGVKSAIAALGAPADKVAAVDLRSAFSYVFVGPDDAPAFEALTGKQHGEKALKVERAKPRR